MIRFLSLILLHILLIQVDLQAAGTNYYTYDSLDRIIKSESTIDNHHLSYTYNYDTAGNITNISVQSIVADVQTIQIQVTEIYAATFGRAPDTAGLAYWVGQVENGLLTVDQVAQSFFDQPETKTKYPQGTSNSAFLTSIYQNVLNRAPDQGGLNYWIGELNRGAFSRSQAIMAIINGAKSTTGDPTDAAILANKEKVGEYFAASTLGSLSDSSKMLLHAQNVMKNIDSSSASVTNAKAYINTLVAQIVGAQEKQSAFLLGPLYSITDLNGLWSMHGLYAGDVVNSYGWNYLTATINNGNWQSSGQFNWLGARPNTSGTWQISADGFKSPGNGILSLNKNIIIETDTANTEGVTPGLSIAIKKSVGFTVADLAGTWHAHCLHVGDGNNANGWSYSSWTIDKNGQAKSSNLISSITELKNFTNSSLDITTDGIVSANDLHGVMSSDKNLLVLTNSDDDSSVNFYDMIILVKAGSTFTQDNLTGNWVMHALMAKDGGNRWAFGNATFDSVGNLSYSRVTTSNGTTLDDVGRAVVATTGIVTFAGTSNIHGVLTPDKNLLVIVGNTNQESERTMLIYVKR